MRSTTTPDTPKLDSEQQPRVVVESKPGAALLVERVDLSDADIQALTVSAQILSANTPSAKAIQPSVESKNPKKEDFSTGT